MNKQTVINQLNQWIKDNPYKAFMFASSIEKTKKTTCTIAIHIFPEMESKESRKKIFDEEQYDCTGKAIIKFAEEWYDNHFDNSREYEIFSKKEYVFSVVRQATPEEKARVERILNPQKIGIEQRKRPPKSIVEILEEVKKEEEEQKAIKQKEREEKRALYIEQVQQEEEDEIEIVQQGLIQVEIKKKKKSNRGKKPQYDWSELGELYKKYGEHYDKIAEVIGCSPAAVRRRIHLGQI